MPFTYTTLLAEINTILSDTSNSLFTTGQKQQAIDMAIDRLWPEMKQTLEDNTVTLVSGTTRYTPTATDVTEWGFGQAYVERETDEPWLLMRGVSQKKVGTSWVVHVEPEMATQFDAKKLRLKYHARHPRLAGAGSIDIPVTMPVVSYALFILMTMFLPKGSHTNIQAFSQQIPLWLKEWQDSKSDNLVLPMTSYIGLRVE